MHYPAQSDAAWHLYMRIKYGRAVYERLFG